jgi:hypothetical protein
MKYNNIGKLSSAILFGSLLLMACEKNKLELSENIDPSNGGYFKLGWFSPGLNTQGVQLKINGVRVSNQLGYMFTSTNTTAAYAMPFPGGGLNTGGNNKNDYLAVDTGKIEVSLAVPKKGTNEDSILVHTTTMNISKGKYYSLIVTDSFPAAASYVQNDDTEYADSGFIRLNFTNAIPNLGAGLDFLVTNSAGTDMVLATNVQYKSSTGFITLPLVTGTNTFKLRKTGTTAIIGATYGTGGVTNKRCFTVVGRGYLGATGVRQPSISIVFNK